MTTKNYVAGNERNQHCLTGVFGELLAATERTICD